MSTGIRHLPVRNMVVTGSQCMSENFLRNFTSAEWEQLCVLISKQVVDEVE